jgi:uncharacterized protein
MYLTRHLVRYKQTGCEIWLNALTGAVDRLSHEEVGLIEGALSRPDVTSEEPLLKQLKSRGYLYPDETAEKQAFDRLVNKHAQAGDSRITNLIICPTYSCNLRCVYCFERLPHGNLSRKSMDLTSVSAALAAFKRIREQEPERRYSLGLFGGEPLLPANRAVVSRIFADAETNSLPVMIVSNGVNVSSFIPVMEEHLSSIWAVQLTIDGPEDVHDERRPTARGKGTFKAVAAAVDLLLAKEIKVVLRANIDRDNIERLPELTSVANARGWAGNPAFSCSLAPVKDHLRSGKIPNVTPEAELLSALLDVYDEDPASEKLFGFEGFQMLTTVAGLVKQGEPGTPRVYHCEANYGGFWVAGPDGYLYACPESIGQPQLAIGRFSPELEIWATSREKWAGRNISTITACGDCQISPLCGGGCTYASLASQLDDSKPACEPGLIDAIDVFLQRRVLTSC